MATGVRTDQQMCEACRWLKAGRSSQHRGESANSRGLSQKVNTANSSNPARLQQGQREKLPVWLWSGKPNWQRGLRTRRQSQQGSATQSYSKEQTLGLVLAGAEVTHLVLLVVGEASTDQTCYWRRAREERWATAHHLLKGELKRRALPVTYSMQSGTH